MVGPTTDTSRQTTPPEEPTLPAEKPADAKDALGTADPDDTSSTDTDLGPEPPSEEPVPDQAGGGDEQQVTTVVDQQVPPKYSSFTLWQKRGIVFAASIGAFFSPLSAQIYFPALNLLSEELHVSRSQINLTVTTYMIFQGITPMFIGNLADTAGRRPAYMICFVVYIAANIGLALSKNYASLLVVRCLQSAGSSSTVALCQAVVSDVITSAERGQYIAITVIPILLGPSLGPVIGGLISQYLGWRAIFWFLTIFAGVCFVIMLLFFPETCRALVGDGSIRPHPFYRTFWQLSTDAHRKRKARKARKHGGLHRTTSTATASSEPTRQPLSLGKFNVFASLVLLFQKELGLLLFYSAWVFAGFYAVSTAMPQLLGQAYGFDELRIGLMYLPMAGGSIFAAFVIGPLINRNYRRHAARAGMPLVKGRQDDLSGFPVERARMEVGAPLLVVAFATTAAWGWAFEARAPVAVPCVLLFLLGIGMIGFSNTVNVLIVDVSPGRAGAAVAAQNVARCLVGAGASAAIAPMIDAMGAGWSFVIVALLYVLFFPMLWLVMAKGVKWRQELAVKEAAKKKRAEEKKARKKREQDGPEDGEVAASGVKEEKI
ncbi:uncharacterized protein E0L32_003169 [Thyridium curvatum]|uniref:Major facilitator superfamily (MFS) profile domain-containing protein n=1 Tax=Thyridium curvatum TaxID=1093900 RepID=A0A507BDY3_9PEZI|nr:uncharacterized protein E0L32_003169 [Thyridium curvatum]TPX17526.1 hypothetical protein E0L32_003169 [Thyridium curvatum]